MRSSPTSDDVGGLRWWKVALGGFVVVGGACSVAWIYRTKTKQKKASSLLLVEKGKTKEEGTEEQDQHHANQRQEIKDKSKGKGGMILKQLPQNFDPACGQQFRRLIQAADTEAAVLSKLGSAFPGAPKCKEDPESSGGDGNCETLENERRRVQEEANIEWVDTVEALEALASLLLQEREISFDTEHHSYYSFRGVICLLQLGIPRTNQCFLVDALQLKPHIGRLMKEVFQSDAILKVGHGLDNDVLWMQRDYGIYLVHVFDTEKACKVLGKTSSSLASLLEQYMGVQKDNQYTTADWRQRPLPHEMLMYGCVDVYFLHSIKNSLVRELCEAAAAVSSSSPTTKKSKEPNKLVLAYQRSQRGTLKSYKPKNKSPRDLAFVILKKGKQLGLLKGKGKMGMKAVVTLCAWRNQVAEEIDVSLHALLPDFVLIYVLTLKLSTTEELLQALKKAIEEYDSRHVDKKIFIDQIVPHLETLLSALTRKTTLSDASAAATPSKEGSLSSSSEAKLLHLPEEKRSRAARHIEKFSRKSPAYENCQMLSETGELLCYCDVKKVKWYLEKNLAEQVNPKNEEPRVIKLLFQHRETDQQTEDGKFYLSNRANQCVGCGETSNYLKYRVTPSCYRKFFPVHWKSHRSHDIVLLCVNCHEVASSNAYVLKKEIASDLGVPLNARSRPNLTTGTGVEHKKERCEVHIDWNDSPAYLEAYRSALALSLHGDTMPEDRKQVLKDKINVSYDNTLGEVTTKHIIETLLMSQSPASRQAIDKLLESIEKSDAEEHKLLSSLMDGSKKKKKKAKAACRQYLHGKMIVNKLLEQGGDKAVLDLIMRFRQHFVDTLNPRYLPESWSVVHAFGGHPTDDNASQS
jgi:cation-transporting P-type ATPase D